MAFGLLIRHPAPRVPAMFVSAQGAPAKGHPDSRAVWDQNEALGGLEMILDTIVDEIAPDGTQFADERESLLWGFVNTLHPILRPNQDEKLMFSLLGRIWVEAVYEGCPSLL